MSKRCSTESEDGGYISILNAYATANKYLDLALRHALKNDIVSRNQYFMAALVIIQLTTIAHPTNTRDKNHVDQRKAKELTQFRVTHKIALCNDPSNSLAIPDEVKKIIKSFYDAWLPDIKEKLQVRGDAHLDKRQGKLISIVREIPIPQSVHEAIIQMINKIKTIICSEFKQYVSKWSGPDFKHLKYRKEDNEVQERLTVVYDKTGFKNRCGNSQEDWFRKFHGRFFEQSIECVASNIVETGCTPQDVLHFLLEMLEATVQFDGAKATALIPGGYLFTRSRCQPLERVIEKWSGACFNELEIAGKTEISKTRLIGFIRGKAQNNDNTPRNENERNNANIAHWGIHESEYVGNDRDEYKQQQAAAIASDANQIHNSTHHRRQGQQNHSVDTDNIQHIEAYGVNMSNRIMMFQPNNNPTAHPTAIRRRAVTVGEPATMPYTVPVPRQHGYQQQARGTSQYCSLQQLPHDVACYYTNHASLYNQNAYGRHQDGLLPYGETDFQALQVSQADMVAEQPVRLNVMPRDRNACAATRHSAEHDIINTRQRCIEQHVVTGNSFGGHCPFTAEPSVKTHDWNQHDNAEQLHVANEPVLVPPQQYDSASTGSYSPGGYTCYRGTALREAGGMQQVRMDPMRQQPAWFVSREIGNGPSLSAIRNPMDDFLFETE